MSIQATTEWCIRTDGDNLNGGGWDSGISGAGSDATDQAAAALTLTDLATSGAGSAILLSVAGGFTNAMVGNCFRISAGTNFTAGYYFVIGYTNGNTVTLDRSATPAGAGVSGVGRVGGAFADPFPLCTSHINGAGPPPITSPLAAGHTVYMRGSGSDDGSADYSINHPEFYYFLGIAGDETNGRIAWIGYNGRPCVSGGGIYFYTCLGWTWENFKGLANSAGYSNNAYGLFSANGSANGITGSMAKNLILDVAGYEVCIASLGHYEDVHVKNSGSTSVGSAAISALSFNGYGQGMRGCSIIGVRTSGVFSVNGLKPVIDTIVANCKGHGIYIDTSVHGTVVDGCTLDGNYGDGIYLDGTGGAAACQITNNLITNHNQTSKTGIRMPYASVALGDRLVRGFINRNFFYNNTTNVEKFSMGAQDVQLSASPYVNSAGNDWSLNTTAGGGAAVRAAGFPGAFRGLSTTGYRDGGAVQHQDSPANTTIISRPRRYM